MNNLSIINEVELETVVKNVTNTANHSQDSGLADSEASNGSSGKISTEGNIIIPFQALNAGVDNIKESTFLGKEKETKNGCDLSNISPENVAKTLNSSDGKIEGFNYFTKTTKNIYSDFSESFDDDFISGGQPKVESEKKDDESQKSDEKVVKDENGKNDGGETTSSDDDFDYEARAKEDYIKKGEPYMAEILPKLPKLRNGMVIMGVHEQSPLVSCGELFKCRIFRPDKPLRTSEVFEDGTTIRFTNLSRLMSDDFTVTRFKIEMATYKVGVAESDMIGTKATPGIFEIEDFGNLTLKPFMERKTKDLMELVTEITVLRKLKENEIMALREKCAKTFGGECEANKMCMICAIGDDVRDLYIHYESQDKNMDFGKFQ